MGDSEAFPSFFHTKAPLHECVNLISFKNSCKNGFYWMLSVDCDPQTRNNRGQSHSALAPYEDNENEMVDYCDLEDNYDINPTKSGKYITSFYVPSLLHSVIIGPRGSKLKELQDNTNTLVKVPRPNEEGLVKITGYSERSVASARTQIVLLLLSKREKLSVTHFVSISMYSDTIKRNFYKFKDDILKRPGTRGIDETIFQKVDKLHLTIVTVALLDERETEDAKLLLSKCQPAVQKIFGNNRPKVVLKGVEIMNDDPSDADVLYGKVQLDDAEQTEKLQEAVDEILEAFYKTNLVRKQYESVKLHVTLMNSLFRKNDGFQKDNKDAANKRESFDATYILQKYKKYYFGKTILDKIHLSVRFTSSQNGYYQYAATITL